MSETRRCEHCGRAMSPRQHRQSHPATGAKVCTNCMSLNSPGWTMTYNSSNQHLAHDSGDGADLAHCPFCGSGGIVGSPDGTVECQFCHKFFTVQVQPEFKNMPQTIDGQPYNIPGMPGGGPDAGAAADAGADAAGDAQAGDDPTPPDQPDDKQVKDEAANPFVEGALLVTAEGVALEPEAYLAHLALAHADDREMVLAQVRLANSRRAQVTADYSAPDHPFGPAQVHVGLVSTADLVAAAYPGVNEDVVKNMAEDMKENGWDGGNEEEPIELHRWAQGAPFLNDGNHRAHAAALAGISHLQAEVFEHGPGSVRPSWLKSHA